MLNATAGPWCEIERFTYDSYYNLESCPQIFRASRHSKAFLQCTFMPSNVFTCLQQEQNQYFHRVKQSINRRNAKVSRTCLTRRSFRRMLHGCILTDCRTSLCNRIFSKICSFVDSWLFAPSPNEMAVLKSYALQCNSFHCFNSYSHIFSFHFISLFSFENVMLIANFT